MAGAGSAETGRGTRLNAITLESVRAVAKPRDAWWTVLLVDPLAIRLVRAAARHAWITPNRLTIAAFAAGLASAAAFAQADPWWLLVGALAYHVSFVIDCMDGKLARLTGTGSALGQWLDFILDRVLVTVCAIALLGGQYLNTRDGAFLVLGAVVVFLNLFHQLNGQIMEGALRQARERVATAGSGSPTGPARSGGDRPPNRFAMIRTILARHRIRADVFSAIEFQMADFIVAPVLAAIAGPRLEVIVPVTAAACALLVAFEVAGIVKFAVTARRLGPGGVMSHIGALPSQFRPPATTSWTAPRD